ALASDGDVDLRRDRGGQAPPAVVAVYGDLAAGRRRDDLDRAAGHEQVLFERGHRRRLRLDLLVHPPYDGTAARGHLGERALAGDVDGVGRAGDRIAVRAGPGVAEDADDVR